MSHSSSEESSDVEAESGAAAAATDASELVAHTALEPALQSLHLEKVIHEPNWDCNEGEVCSPSVPTTGDDHARKSPQIARLQDRIEL